jgi:Protein of unknown function (DUF998)
MSELFPQASPANQSASSRGVAVDPAPAVPVPRKLLLWLTYGVAGTVLFPIIYLIEGATRPGYNAWQQAISTLSLGPGGWIQQANFIMCGVSVIWLAFVWRQILKGGVCARWYPIVRGIEGLGLIMIGFFSTDRAPGYPPGTVVASTTLQGTIHLTFTIIVVNAMALGLFIIAWRFWREPDFRGWVAYSVISGLLTVVFITGFGVANALHSPYTGIFERLATNTDTVWGAVLLIPLWAGRRLMRSNV